MSEPSFFNGKLWFMVMYIYRCTIAVLVIICSLLTHIQLAAQCNTPDNVKVCDESNVEFINLYNAPGFPEWICLENQCLETALPASSFNALTTGPCAFDPDSKTTWYTLYINDFPGDLFINLQAEDYFAPKIAVFEGSCINPTLIACASNNSYEISIPRVPVNRLTYYHIAVTSEVASNASYSLCVMTTDRADACDQDAQLREVSSSDNTTPEGGPYSPGETVRFRATVNYNTQDACNWLKGIVPRFGSGWTGYNETTGLPDMVFETPTPVADSATWSWYNPTSVDYNLRNPWLSPIDFSIGALIGSPYLDTDVPALGLNFGTMMPGGWYASQPDGILPDNSPNNTWGDGVACSGSHGPFIVEFELRVKDVFDTPLPGDADCSVEIALFAGGEIGTTQGSPCIGLLPITHQAMGRCISDITLEARDTFVCNNVPFVVPVAVSNDTAIVTWTADIPDGVEGDPDGEGSVLEQRLFNETNMPQDVIYTFVATHDGCSSSFDLTITVYPDETSSVFPENLTYCGGSVDYSIDLPIGLDIVSLNPSSMITASIFGDQLMVNAQAAGSIEVSYSTPCAADTLHDLIQLTADTQVLENDYVVCSGRPLAPFNQVFTKDTQLVNITQFGECILMEINNITVLYADAGPDAEVGCGSDTILLVGSSYDTAAFRAWMLPNGVRMVTDSIYVSHPGNYVYEVNYFGGCTVSDTVFIDSTYSLNIETYTTDCLLDSLKAAVTGLQNPVYHWSNGSNRPVITALPYRWYSVEVSDTTSPGCSISTNIFTGLPDSCESVVSGYVYNQFGEDCSASSPKWPVEDLKIEVVETGQVFSTNTDGFYQARLPLGSYTLKPLLANTPLAVCPDSLTVNLSDPNAPIDSLSFCLIDTADCGLMVVASSSLARPGRDVNFGLQITNVGNVRLENIDITGLFDSHYDFDMVTPVTPIDNIDVPGSTIEWSVDALNPGEETYISVIIKLDPTGLMGGDILRNQFVISGTTCGDQTTNYNQVVRTSYDPNDKILENIIDRPDGSLYRSDSILTYTIRFENTGNDTAFLIRVTDVISDALDLSTFTPGPSSHPYTWQILAGRQVEFTFDPIELPYNSIDSAGAQGFVTFQIKPLELLSDGDTISNNADIYFDFNPPVRTNTVTSGFNRPLFVSNIDIEVCAGDEWNGSVIESDTTFEDLVAFFDFDSLYLENVTAIQPIIFQEDTAVVAGDTVLGFEINADTTLEQMIIDPESGCANFIVWNITLITSVNDPGINALKVYPNPMSDVVFIESETGINYISIVHLSGKKMLDRSYSSPNQVQIRTEEWTAGIYLIQITLEDGNTRLLKVVKQ